MARSPSQMDVDEYHSTLSDAIDRPGYRETSGAQYDGKSTKRVRVPPVTKLVKWHDLPNWYSRKDTPILNLPKEILDRLFSLETGLGLRDYVALAGVNTMFRNLFDDALFKELCIHFGLADKLTLPPTGAPLTNQIFSRDVAEWRVPKLVVRIRDIPSNTYIPRGKREDWSREQYAVYRQERDIHLMTHRVARYKAGYEASEKRKAAEGRPIEHPPVKDGTATRQVIGVVNGSRPGQRPFGPKGEAGDQQIARYDHAAYERRLGRRVWKKERLEELEAELEMMIHVAEHPPREEDAPRGPWVVPSTPEDKDDPRDGDVYEFDPTEWSEQGFKVIHDFWPSPWRAKAVASLYEKRINKTTANDIYKVTDAELATLKHVLAVRALW
ncbi:hypothetical protein CC85DRAFT_288464 [Cutaneotrichosporon oleaginosum]|uniref:F-box domain-containing protein n=1 Tax=Cutaneotrichosporon oleaginosum TaxID=879819 RepID=A0A0J0XEK9_9TREE|nr:uncharacterized protein CC85DRAFT_288464 [Cutaneotrichosporon oleaginosum]KLT39483.1 hypothetical protein CC85DRAFT_288464 [Cutaneotrichosporon oleaginosum]TXT06852.1 hypothetical protein COLE_06183 [Cutaneotrichosporon oleaginosum]